MFIIGVYSANISYSCWNSLRKQSFER